jgi:hypothetical protein
MNQYTRDMPKSGEQMAALSYPAPALLSEHAGCQPKLIQKVEGNFRGHVGSDVKHVDKTVQRE